MEKSEQALHDLISIPVQGMGEVQMHQSAGQHSILLEGAPMDIALVCIREGNVFLENSFAPHPIELASGEGIWLAFPKGHWSSRISIQGPATFYLIRMEAKAFHHLLNPRFDQQHLESAPKLNMRDMAKRIAVSPTLMVCFDQLFHQKLQKPFHAIFEQAKFLEIFSLLMEATLGQHHETCPVMITPAIEHKIHLVRRHIIGHLEEVPDPDHLALLYELPRNTLREGYRFMFGKTIHQYHADHKLEYAMQMLSSGELLVKEIAFRIGYQNPSHFISAFKKKYGYTPKQYLKREAISA